MYRIHTTLCSLREHLTWKRGSANQQNEETSDIPFESSNVNCTITKEEIEEEKSQETFEVDDGDDHIINTFDTEQAPYTAPPELSTRDRIQNGIFKLMSTRKKLRQDVDKLQMSIMYPPGCMPLNPIVELDEQAPESLNEANILTLGNKKSFLKSIWNKAVNATQFISLWEESADTFKTYSKGIYWVCYAAPGKFVYLYHHRH